MATAGDNHGEVVIHSDQALQSAPTMLSEDTNAKPPSRAPARKEYKGLRRIIRNFTPSWFAITMGTGIVSLLLHGLPYNGHWLYWLSIIFFALNVLLFTLFLCLSIARYTMYPEIWGLMIRHPTQSLFLGTVPMGLATIVNMLAFVCVPAWGRWAISLTWALWWLDAVTAVAICFYLPFVLMTVHQNKLASMTAVWLLPIVSTIVAAASGAIVADILPNPQHALWTLMTSYVLWGIGGPLAMATLVLYFQRLALYNLPPREVIVSVFLPLGPLGQGAFGIMKLGSVAMKLFPKTGVLIPNAGEILYVLGFLMALVMWGFALAWWFFALASILRSPFPFNIGWWSFTFPIGVFATATVMLGQEMPSRFFSVLGTILSVVVILLWVLVASETIRHSISGKLFYAPCLQDIGDSKDVPEKTDKHV